MRKFLFLITILAVSFFFAVHAWASEPATPEMTVNDAIQRALTHSNSIKKAAKSVDLTDYVREYKADRLNYMPTEPPGMPAVEATWADLLTANLNWRMAEKSLTAEEDKVALDACNKYWSIQQAIGNVETAKLSLKQAELDWQKASAYNKAGLTSMETLLGAEAQLSAAKAALKDAQNNLDKAYADFNQLIGLRPEDRPVLTDEIVFAPLEETNLNFIVATVIENSPTVWLAQQKVELQKTLENLMFYTGEYVTYKQRKTEVEQARLDAASAEDAVETLTRALYYSVRTLEENYPAAEQAVKVAEENLRVTELKYQVGMAIKADVVASEASLAQARQKLLDLKKNHAYLKLALTKPWAYQISAMQAS